jgi:methylphosphotriester-DNA--protein-cysteine methyltransferase
MRIERALRADAHPEFGWRRDRRSASRRESRSIRCEAARPVVIEGVGPKELKMLSPDIDTNPHRQRTHAYSDDDAGWEAVRQRDRGADGVFFCAVRTTGVYCRPSCAGRPHRENVTFYATAAEAERAGFRPCKRCRPAAVASELEASRGAATRSIAARVSSLDWERIAADLDAFGCATTGTVLTPPECRALAASYEVDELFRSRIIMARHGFGRGEYKYFSYPLPAVIAALRAAFYPPLAAVANRWNEAMNIARRFPEDHSAYLADCHAAG